MQAPASSASGRPATPSRSRDLSAGYRGVPVVRELNLEVRPGEVVALLGPNGAGKTTTLETIAGLHRPISGTVELSGEDVGGTPAHVLARRGLALVPEGRALFPGLTVREHLRLAGGRGAAGSREGPGGHRPRGRAAGDAPRAAQVPGPQGRPAVRRRAADAGRRPRAGHPAAAAARRRDEPGARPGDRRAAAPDPAPGGRRTGHAACCSSSSTSRWRWRSPTAPTS